MTRLTLGVALDALGLPVRAGLDAAARLALDGVQMDAVGPVAPDQLTATGRREFRTLLRSHLLELTALNCPLRRGLDNPEQLSARLDHLRKVATLAVDLGCRRLVLPFPALPRDDEPARAATLKESLQALAAVGDSTGVVMALEPGRDPAAATRSHLAAFDTGSLRVNFDPATLLFNNHDPVAYLAGLGDLVDHVHARDAVRSVSAAAREAPAGAGDADWNLLLATLEAGGYRGTLTADSEAGPDRAAAARAGVQFLRRFVPPPRR